MLNETLKDIAIFGAGGLGREIALLVHELNQQAPTWNLLGFFDDKAFAEPVNGLPYLGNLQTLNSWETDLHVVVAVGNCQVKEKLVTGIRNQLIQFPVLVHPTVVLQPYHFCQIGEGTVICQNSVITTNVSIGRHVLVSPACNLAHDTTVHDFCSLMYAVNLAGNVALQPLVYAGTNATILQGLTIGRHSTVGAGAVVTKNVPENCTVAGVPAKIIKHHEIPA